MDEIDIKLSCDLMRKVAIDCTKAAREVDGVFQEALPNEAFRSAIGVAGVLLCYKAFRRSLIELHGESAEATLKIFEAEVGKILEKEP